MWPERARQIEQTVEAFSKGKLEKAVTKLFDADRDLRDARIDMQGVLQERQGIKLASLGYDRRTDRDAEEGEEQPLRSIHRPWRYQQRQHHLPTELRHLALEGSCRLM